MHRFWIIAIALVMAAPASAQNVRAGIEAWGAGQPEKAIAIWRPLAAKGQADAAFNLGQAYKLGRGVPIDLAQAQRFYEQAARGGHLEAQTSLGLLLFQNGGRVPAMRWLKQAADSGEPRAMLVYGTALFNGDGVPVDRIRAYALVSRAAAQGLAPARITLAEMDQLIPLADRQRGVALAKDLANANTPVPSPTKAAPAKALAARTPQAKATGLMLPAAGGAFRVQLGAFRDTASAQRLFAALSSRLPGARMTLVSSGTMTRLQVGPYPTRAAAAAVCTDLRPQPCFPVSVR
jgi:cell division septation protein DedD